MRRNACGSSISSRGAASATDRASSTSSTSRSTKALARSGAGSRCGLGVVLRRGHATSARWSGFSPHGEDVIGGPCDPAGVGDGGGLGGRGKCRLHHRCDGAASARIAAASFSQVERCSISERGSCLARGLQRRLLGQVQRFDRGRRPAMIFLELDREFTAADVDVSARVDQRWFSRGSTPTISRIGRFAGSVPARSANRTPRHREGAARARCCSSPTQPHWL